MRKELKKNETFVYCKNYKGYSKVSDIPKVVIIKLSFSKSICTFDFVDC